MINAKPMLLMLCSIPGAGKSVCAEKYAKDHKNTIIHSSDALREELFGNVNEQNNNEVLFTELHRRIKADLLAGKNVIYDACNIHSKNRRAFLDSIKNVDCYKEAWIIATPYEICLRNNTMRERKVPNPVIERMYRHWQTPWYFEGWDFIKVINDYKGYNNILKMYDVNNYHQNNPHHTKSLGIHQMMTKEYVRSHGGDTILMTAASYHDIGKPFCRFDDEKGISHYYNHESVGAYDALSIYDLPIEVSAIINYHMSPIGWHNAKEPDKVMEKWRKIWGNSFYDKVTLLNKADEAAR